jgi:hypothetical protein
MVVSRVQLALVVMSVFMIADFASGAAPKDPVTDAPSAFPSYLPGCAEGTPITIEFHPDPVFSWDSECAASDLIVEQADSGVHQWVILTNPAVNVIASPVQYGMTPDGAMGFGPTPLVEGSSYELFLWSRTGPDNTIPTYVGNSVFTVPVRVPSEQATWTMIKAAYR